MKNNYLISFAKIAVLFFFACSSNSTDSQEMVTRVGKMAEFIMQHPMINTRLVERDGNTEVVEDPQLYLDEYLDGKKTGQIILLFDQNVEGKLLTPPPQETEQDLSRMIKVTGLLEIIDFGGPSGTKDSYRNEVIHVIKWEYLD